MSDTTFYLADNDVVCTYDCGCLLKQTVKGTKFVMCDGHARSPSLVWRIAAMNYDGEDVDGQPFAMANDDTHHTLVALIHAARAIVNEEGE